MVTPNQRPADTSWLPTGGPPKRRKKNTEPSCQSTILPVDSTPKAMHFPPSQVASATVGSDSLRSQHGSNQLEPLFIEYPLLPSGETTPLPATSMPTEQRKEKGKVKAQGKAKAEVKRKKKKIGVPPDSPAMATRSKTPQKQSPAAHIRSKRKLPDLNL